MAAAEPCQRDGCDRTFDPDLDHSGHPHTGYPRRYCSPDCYELAELARRRDQRAAVTARRRLETGRAALIDLEAREPTLPAMPRHPLLEDAPHG